MLYLIIKLSGLILDRTGSHYLKLENLSGGRRTKQAMYSISLRKSEIVKAVVAVPVTPSPHRDQLCPIWQLR